MALPSGYKRLEYIQSSGTQYINSQYKATSENYRIKCRFKFVTIVDGTTPFGGGASTDIISVLIRNSAILHFYVGSGSVSATDVTITAGVEYEMECHANNGTFTVILNGVTYSGSYSGQINKDYPLFLFANNVSGTPSQFSSVCYLEYQIYDNGVLVRDYIPCTNVSNAVGLWDDANSEFYPNAGSGAFTAGPEVVPDDPLSPVGDHNTNIGDVSREVEGGTALIGGVGWDFEKGLTLTNGIVREIAFVGVVGDMLTVEIAGTGSSAYAFVSLGANIHTSAKTVEVPFGTRIVITVASNSSSQAVIRLNGRVIKTIAYGTTSYEMAVEQDMNILLYIDSANRFGIAQITT